MRLRLLFVLVAMCAVVAAIVAISHSGDAYRPATPPPEAIPAASAEARPRHESTDPPPENAATPPDAEARRIFVHEVQSKVGIAGVTVVLEYDGGRMTTFRTGADGVAVLPEDCGTAHVLRVFAPGRVRHGWFRDTAPSYFPPRDVELQPGVPLAGRVLDATDGRPIAGAALTVTQDWNFGGGGNGPPPPPAFEDRTTSDGDGRFTFPGVPSANSEFRWVRGDLSVHAERPGFVAASEVATRFFGGVSVHDVVFRLDPDAPIEGVVRAPDGTAVANAEVFLLAENERAPQYRPEPHARSGPDGAFRITGQPRGARVTIGADADGLASSPKSAVVAPTATPVVLTLRELRRFQLRVTGPDDVDLRDCDVAVYVPGRSFNIESPDGDSPISIGPVEPGCVGFLVGAAGMAKAFRWFDEAPSDGGRFTMQLEHAHALEGVVTDDTGAPIEDASVAAGPAVWSGTMATALMVQETKTDALGRFRVEGLATGDLVLYVESPEHTRASLPVRVADSPVRVVLDRMASLDVALVVPEGMRAPNECGVYLLDGSPRFPHPPWSGGDSRYHVAGEIRDGRLRVLGIPPGKFAIEVCIRDYRVPHVEAEFVAGRVAGVTELRLDPGLTVEGVVLDPEGRPVPNVRVSSWGNERDSGVGDTDEGGRFRIGELAPGSQILRVTGTRMEARFEVDVGSATPFVTLRMQRTRRVRVRLCDVSGVPQPGFLLLLLDPLGHESWDAVRSADAAGWTSWDLLPGTYATRCADAQRTARGSSSFVVEPAPPGDDPGVNLEVQVPADGAAAPK